MIQRYKDVWVDSTDGQWVDFQPSSEGLWVLYDDHKKVMQERVLSELSALGQAEEAYAREQQLVKDMVEAWRSVRDTASRPHLVKLAKEMLVKLGDTI